MDILGLIIGGFLGTILRFKLCSFEFKKYPKYNIGLYISNMLGILAVLLLQNVSIIISLGFLGSLTSISSLVKEPKEFILFTVLSTILLILIFNLISTNIILNSN